MTPQAPAWAAYAGYSEPWRSGRTPRRPRDRALLRLAFDLGLRRGELASLDLEHLDLEAGMLAVLGKGQEGREQLTLPPETTACCVSGSSDEACSPVPPSSTSTGPRKAGG